MKKTILDVACGGKMFYFDKNDPRVLFCDNRNFKTTLCDGRQFAVKPDVICDFAKLPFEDNSYSMVVFDPPHILKIGENSWTAKKYGKLPNDWKEMLQKGFKECFRVLKPGGFLIFKWNETEIKVSEVLALTPEKPVFGHRSGKASKTHWICFCKKIKEN